MSTRLTAVALSFIGALTICCLGVNPQTVAADDPLGQLAGDWVVDGFVIGEGGHPMIPNSACGSVTVAPARGQDVSISVSCHDAGDYTLRLKHGSGGEAYLMTVKSKYGISIEDFPLEYVTDWIGAPVQDSKVWLGTRDQLVDNETVSVTAMMGRIEGRNWRGWRIAVLPTEATKLPGGDEAVKKPYFFVDLTRRK